MSPSILPIHAEKPDEVSAQTRERRNSRRYRIKSGIAALMLPDRSKIASIIDISSTGLSFVCPQCAMKKDSLFEMDILLLGDIKQPDNDIFFPNVQCTVVAAQTFTEPAARTMQTMTRCSVRFHAAIPLESHPLRKFVQEKPAA